MILATRFGRVSSVNQRAHQDVGGSRAPEWTRAHVQLEVREREELGAWADLDRVGGTGPAGGHCDLLTISVGTSSGGFILSDHSGHSNLGDGRALAAALGDLPLYGHDVRVWLSRPVSAQDRQSLRRNFSELAALTGATIWVPANGGRAEILDGCGDLSAVGPDDQPTRWEPYGDDGARFVSDMDGRLVPAGGVVVSSYPAVPLVSVLPERARDAIVPDEPLSLDDGLFRVDLEVLTDGRLALCYDDGSILAVGDRQFMELLQRSGWSGGPIVVISSVSTEQAVGARRHADSLADHLGCPVTIGEPPAPEPLEPTGTAISTGPDGHSRLVIAQNSRDALGYSTAAVGRALAALDPGDRHEAALLIKIAAAVADHTTGGGRLARTEGAEHAMVGRELAETANLIATLTDPWRHESN